MSHDASPSMLKVARTSVQSAIVKNGLEGVLVRSVDEHLVDSRAKKCVGAEVWFGMCFNKS